MSDFTLANGGGACLPRVRATFTRPHPEEPRSGVSKDDGRDAAAGPSWFARRCEASSGDGAVRLLTKRVMGLAAVARKQKVSQSFQADLPGPAARKKTNRFARDPNQS